MDKKNKKDQLNEIMFKHLKNKSISSNKFKDLIKNSAIPEGLKVYYKEGMDNNTEFRSDPITGGRYEASIDEAFVFYSFDSPNDEVKKTAFLADNYGSSWFAIQE